MTSRSPSKNPTLLDEVDHVVHFMQDVLDRACEQNKDFANCVPSRLEDTLVRVMNEAVPGLFHCIRYQKSDFRFYAVYCQERVVRITPNFTGDKKNPWIVYHQSSEEMLHSDVRGFSRFGTLENLRKHASAASLDDIPMDPVIVPFLRMLVQGELMDETVAPAHNIRVRRM